MMGLLIIRHLPPRSQPPAHDLHIAPTCLLPPSPFKPQLNLPPSILHPIRRLLPRLCLQCTTARHPHQHDHLRAPPRSISADKPPSSSPSGSPAPKDHEEPPSVLPDAPSSPELSPRSHRLFAPCPISDGVEPTCGTVTSMRCHGVSPMSVSCLALHRYRSSHLLAAFLHRAHALL
ncbi:protein TRACHEARY ELEMENT DIFFERENTIATION-RELATED 7A-like [Phragmites australis]|uniref:protein TRACHEARY ELEMENT DIFFERENTIATION-RELATED 7A-like n=1 Tax=Phragmites australis TaxID=29695 RepID=UPI002D7A032E|nr:protein TRACHEARY ELEMENT DIFFERENTIATION-RELATED 7A-like [Phragmites australis]